ncbi:hypothetical protein [Lysobacter auxotrophicus]|uniref:MarR family transcriptional regulator n=1 Tax=Lysobacter auxotrophicus TaxID=2992573 RepID=A0ABN6UK09_9GAMM|nr:hypothetical protein [Lysobacter auxotrophicus]BDU16644.1 MarR family transcriptional regulator [Lysobacter auxotrophicus]
MRRFVVARIRSVPMLEALLLVRSSAEEWRVPKLVARLYLPEARVMTLIEELCSEGLASFDDGMVRYAPSSRDVDEMVSRIAAIYSRHVVAVTELIHSALERQAQDFADAFRLRRDK